MLLLLPLLKLLVLRPRGAQQLKLLVLRQRGVQLLPLLPIPTRQPNTTLNTRLLMIRIRLTSLRTKHVMGTSFKVSRTGHW